MRKDEREKLEKHIKTKIERSPNILQLSYITHNQIGVCHALYECGLLNFLQFGRLLHMITCASEEAQKRLMIVEGILNNDR